MTGRDLHSEQNLRYAGFAIIAAGFLFGALIGRGVETEICSARPLVARTGMAIGAALIVLFDLVLRATHEQAAASLGARRFLDAPSGARVARVVPAWMAGLVLLLYAGQDGLRHGFC